LFEILSMVPLRNKFMYMIWPIKWFSKTHSSKLSFKPLLALRVPLIVRIPYKSKKLQHTTIYRGRNMCWTRRRGEYGRYNFNPSKSKLIICGFNVANKYFIYFINLNNSVNYFTVIESCTEVKNITKYNLKVISSVL
jgi:hypothetical protein